MLLTSLTAALAFAPIGAAYAQPSTYGYTEGSLDVGPMGSSAVNIPIQIAPGTAGLQPQLSLRYDSSNRSNGVLGVGFTLAGLSRIHRCPKTLPTYANRGRTGTDAERLCIDGQLLLSEAGLDASDASYWSSIYFRTLEDSGVRVRRRGSSCRAGTCYFDVYRPDGSVARYGRNGSDGVEAMVGGFGSSAAGHGNVTVAWLLRRITDRLGNRMTFDYSLHEHQSYLTQISYGGRSVEMSYEVRTHARDIERQPYPAFERVQRWRLAQIDAKVDGQTFKSYRLGYTHGDRSAGLPGPSQLSRVEECDGDGHCHAPLLIDWLARSQNDHSYATSINQTNLEYLDEHSTRAVHYGDFDGRGRTGALTRSLHASGIAYIFYWSDEGIENRIPIPDTDLQNRLKDPDVNVYLGDFNGDGKTDILTQRPNNSSYAVNLHTSHGNGQFSSTSISALFNKWNNGSNAVLYPGDFDGDGKTDLLRQERGAADNDINETFRVLLSRGDGTFRIITPGHNRSGDQYQDHLRFDLGYRIIPGDHDGDGLTDFLAINVAQRAAPGDRYLRVFLSNGDGSFALTGPTGRHQMRGQYINVIPGDFNGDGKMDFLRQEKGSWAGDARRMLDVYLSRGDGSFKEIYHPAAYQHSGMSGSAGCKLHAGDFNGDGKTDFARQELGSYANNTIDSFSIFYATGDGHFQKVTPTDASYQDYMRYDYGSADGVTLDLGDFNGDGQIDILSRPRGSANHTARLHTLQADPYAGHLIRGIRDGAGLGAEVSYFPLGKGGLNASETPYVHAEVPADVNAQHGGRLRPLSSGPWLVSEVRRFETAAESTTTERQSFVYEGMVMDPGGVGPVGFQRTTTTMHATGTVRSKALHVEPPLRGRLKQQTLRTLDGTLLSEETYSYAVRLANSSIRHQFTRPVQLRSTSYEGGVPTRTVTRDLAYDRHGNAIWERRTEGTEVTATICRSFEASSSSGWYRGRMLESTTVAGAQCTLDSSQGSCSCPAQAAAARKALVYDADGNVSEERAFDAVSQTWETTRHSYDAWGNVVSTTDPAGVVTRFEYDPTFHTFLTKEVLDPTGANLETSYVVDPRFGEPVLERGPTGVASVTVLDSFGRMQASLLEPTGNRAHDTWTCFRDPSCGTAVRETLEEISYFRVGGVERTSYDGGQVIGRMRVLLDPWGRTARKELLGTNGEVQARTFGYDLAGRLIEETQSHAPGATPVSTRYTYDAKGRPLTVTAPSGAVATLAYAKNDAACGPNELAVTTDLSSGSETRRTLECRDLREAVTRRRFGAQAATGASVPEQRFDFDLFGRLVRAWSPSGSGGAAVLDTTYVYDALGRKVRVENGERGTFDLQYAQGRLVRKMHGSDVWRYEYDSAGRSTAEVLPDGTRLERTFDGVLSPFGLGRMQREDLVSPNGQVASTRSYAYDAQGEVMGETVQVDGRTFALGYTHRSDGTLASVSYPDGSRLSFSHDPLGNLTALDVEETENGLTRTTRYVELSDYSVLGQPGRIDFGNGVRTQYDYDGVGRLARVLTSSQSGSFLDKSYTWSGFGEVTAITDALRPTLSQSFVFDERGYLTEATGAYGRRSYAYDAHGNLTQKGPVSFTHQGAQLSATSDGEQFEYDARGNRSIKRSGSSSTRYTYSGLDQLTEVTREVRGFSCDPDPTVPCADVARAVLDTFEYDASGARIKKTDKDGVTSIYVSPLYEVTIFPNGTELHTRYLNGPAGRIVAISDEVTPPSSSASAASTGAGASPKAPAVGMLLVCGAFSLFIALVWVRAAERDSALGGSRAAAVRCLRELGLINAERAARWSEAYGTAFMQTRRGFGAALPLCAFYVSLSVTGCQGPMGDEVIKVRGGTHGLQRLGNGMLYGQLSYALLPGANGDGYPVAGTHFFHPDHLGSSTYVTDALGHKVAETVYAPFGEIYDPASTGVDAFRSKFTGKEWDAGAELYYFEARHYDPYVGRFIQADIMVVGSDGGLASDLNRYAYAGNNPVVFTDPSGRFIFTVLTILAVATISGAVNVGISAAVAAGTGQEFGWKQAGIAFAVGFVAGGITAGAGAAAVAAGFGAYATAAVTVSANFAAGFAGSVLDQGLSQGFDDVDWGFAAINGTIDAVTGGVIDTAAARHFKKVGERTAKRLSDDLKPAQDAFEKAGRRIHEKGVSHAEAVAQVRMQEQLRPRIDRQTHRIAYYEKAFHKSPLRAKLPTLLYKGTTRAMMKPGLFQWMDVETP